MIVKPSLTFLTNDSDISLVVDAGTIVSSLTDNASYPAPAPTLPVITAALNEFATALAAAAGGGVTFTSSKNARRVALVALLRPLASYVHVACNGNLMVLQQSGFPIQKPQRNRRGLPSTPGNVRVKLGQRMGELNLAVSPVFGVAVYNWKLMAANAPTVILQTAQTTAANNIFANLTPGVVYLVEVNAVNTAGTSDWSNPVSQMVV